MTSARAALFVSFAATCLLTSTSTVGQKREAPSASRSQTIQRPNRPKTATILKAIDRGLAWLRAHQDPQGFWNAGGTARSAEAVAAKEPANHSIGITALSLIALLGEGVTRSPEQSKPILKGFAWLQEQADKDTGRIGAADSPTLALDHCLATWAMADMSQQQKNPFGRLHHSNAVEFILKSSNKDSLWAQDFAPNQASDIHTTALALWTLAISKQAGSAVPENVLSHGALWLEAQLNASVMDTVEAGTKKEHLPKFDSGTLQCILLLVQIFQDMDLPTPDPNPETEQQQGKDAPWNRIPPAPSTNSMQWFMASQASYQFGGPPWFAWVDPMQNHFLGSQDTSEEQAGSWSLETGSDSTTSSMETWGGRTYGTAMALITMQTPFLYARILNRR